MGKRGPAPKPTALKQAAGNPGRRQLNESEPVPPPGEIKPPAWLSIPAQAIWAELAPICIAMRTLTTADRLPFGRYCNAFARYLELQDFCWRKGATGTTYPLKDQAGKVRCMMELPQAAELRRIHETLLRLEQQFGLTPAARSRINVQPATTGAAAPAPSAPSDGRSDEIKKFFAGGGPRPPARIITG